MIIGTSVDSSVQLAHQMKRQREIDSASQRLASGSRTDRIGNDAGAYTFSARLGNQIRADQAASDSLHNAITYVQTQSDGLRSADRVLLRMSELAYLSSDPVLTSYDRLRYQSEFSSLQTHLSYLAVEQFNDESLFDPQASKYADVYPVEGVSDGGWEKQEKIVDIGALSGSIRLWWNSTWQTDRLKVYQGASMLFDSGEFRASHWGNFPDPDEPGLQGTGDLHRIDFSPGSVKVTSDPGNLGISLHDKDAFDDLKRMTGPAEWAWIGGDIGAKNFINRFVTSDDYPKSAPPAGDSTQIRFVVNEDPGGFPFPRQPASNTVWAFSAEITKESLPAKSVLSGADGDMIDLQNVGFSTLSELSIGTLDGALNALDVIALEQENVRYQQGVIGSEIARFRSQATTLDHKTMVESRAVERIVDTNVAEEVTRMAKNLLLQKTSSAVLTHARISAGQVYKSLL